MVLTMAKQFFAIIGTFNGIRGLRILQGYLSLTLNQRQIE